MVLLPVMIAFLHQDLFPVEDQHEMVVTLQLAEVPVENQLLLQVVTYRPPQGLVELHQFHL